MNQVYIQVLIFSALLALVRHLITYLVHPFARLEHLFVHIRAATIICMLGLMKEPSKQFVAVK